MSEQLELEIVDLGDALDQTKGWLEGWLYESNPVFPYWYL